MTAAPAGLIAQLIEALAPPGTAVATGSAAVTADELQVLLVAAQVAPSADNAQIWRFITVEQPAIRSQLASAVATPMRETVAAAPLVIVACGDRFLVTRSRREQPFALVDVPIAVTHLLLKAAEMGLGCAWTLDVDAAAVRGALGIPDTVRVVALLALGGLDPKTAHRAVAV